MIHSSLKVVATLTATLFLSSAVNAYDQDMNFASEGFAYSQTEHSSIPHALLMTQDGRLVSVGRSIVDNRSGNFTLNITDSEGNTIITTETPVTSKRDVAHKVIELSTGVLLVLGEANAHGAVVAYDSEGNFLEQYTSSSNHTFYRDAIEQTDGKIVVVGYQRFAGVPGFSVIATRFNSDYSVDTTFGDNGLFQDPYRDVDSNWNSLAYAVDLQSDGKIILGTHVNHLTNTMPEFDEYSVIFRLTEAGQLDTTFGESETTPLRIIEDYVIRDLKVGQDDTISSVGKSSTTARAVKVLADGSALDTSFSRDGIADVDSTEGTEGFMAMTLKPRGGILATGYSGNGTVDLLVAHFNKRGKPGRYFGTRAGYKVFDYGETDYGRDLIQNSDGELFVVGNIAHDDYSKDMVLIKFIRSGREGGGCRGKHRHGKWHKKYGRSHGHSSCKKKINMHHHRFRHQNSRKHIDYTFVEMTKEHCMHSDERLEKYDRYTSYTTKRRWPKAHW